MSWRHHKRHAKENSPEIWEIMTYYEKRSRDIAGGLDTGLIALEMGFDINQLRKKLEHNQAKFELEKDNLNIELDKVKEELKHLTETGQLLIRD